MHTPNKIFIILFSALLTVTMVQAQKKKKAAAAVKKEIPAVALKENAADTVTPKMVTITSAFKPVLQSAAKLNFIAATPVIDSSKIPVVYNIPSQNLFFSYQPVAIKPLALNIDSTVNWQNDQYIKLGAGNFSSFLGEAAFSFGDGKHSITNLRGNFLTATGNMFAQQANKYGIDVLSNFHAGESSEWTTHAYYQSSTQYFYGFQPSTASYLKEDLLQRFNTVGVEAGLQNTTANSLGVSYHPQLSFIRFSDNHELSENDLIIKAPFSKAFNKFYSVNLGMGADISNTSATNVLLVPGPVSVKNNLYYVHPAFQLTTPNVKLHIGMQPSWNNGSFAALPELTIEAKLTDMAWLVEAGWTGKFQKNTFRSLAAINPWINSYNGSIGNLSNTKIIEQYVGVKGGNGSHFNYEAKFSFLKLNNQALFVNYVLDGNKSFIPVFEPQMQAVRLHAEAGYTVGESLSFLASTSYTSYTSLQVNQKAWGLLPFEMTGTMKWKLRKDLLIKADAFLWDGSPYIDKSGKAAKSDPVADINLGAEFTIVPRLNIWLQMNNMLNSTYQRWNQYPVLGFNVLGGVVYSFR